MSNLSFPLIPRSRNTPAAKIATNTTVGKSGLMPGKFGVASNGSMFSNARKVYNADAGGGQNYHPSSSYTYLKKITAIGKSSSLVPVKHMPPGIPNKQQLAFAGGNRNVVNSALRKVRGGGAAYRSKNYSQFKYSAVPHTCNNFKR
jgi:hypothetical protein